MHYGAVLFGSVSLEKINIPPWPLDVTLVHMKVFTLKMPFWSVVSDSVGADVVGAHWGSRVWWISAVVLYSQENPRLLCCVSRNRTCGTSVGTVGSQIISHWVFTYMFFVLGSRKTFSAFKYLEISLPHRVQRHHSLSLCVPRPLMMASVSQGLWLHTWVEGLLCELNN